MSTTPKSSISLLYHDIVEEEQSETSGIVTEGSWRYKVPPNRFQSHLEVISDSQFTPKTLSENIKGRQDIYLTFDDGGRTCMNAATILEDFGYRGHFFIITDRVGEKNYISWADIRELDERGHIIGSHTESHPNLLDVSPDKCERELSNSKRIIENHINSNCQSLSIPMGQYNNNIFEVAKEIGYEYIFTSEPERIKQESTLTLGRWNIWHDTTEKELQKILTANLLYYIRVSGRWRGLKFIKSVIGRDNFIRLRNILTNRI